MCPFSQRYQQMDDILSKFTPMGADGEDDDSNQNGCRWKGTWLQLEEHIKTCLFRLYKDMTNDIQSLRNTVNDQQTQMEEMKIFIDAQTKRLEETQNIIKFQGQTMKEMQDKMNEIEKTQMMNTRDIIECKDNIEGINEETKLVKRRGGYEAVEENSNSTSIHDRDDLKGGAKSGCCVIL